MKTLLNNQGFENDIFIYKPNVIILSKLNIECLENTITFLIAGISIETSMELIAHKEASVARLTTSKIKAMDDENCMYRIFTTLHTKSVDTQIQKDYILNIKKIRDEYKKCNIFSTEPEIFNILNIGSKATALTYTITLENLHSLFIGRVNFDGNESEVREVIKMMIDKTHNLFPNIIKSWDEYMNMKNTDKYIKLVNPVAILDGDYISSLTLEAKKLFKNLNINERLPEYLQIAEFKSRITYFTFAAQMPTYEKAVEYLNKIIIEFGHLSVTSSFQILNVCGGIITTKNFKKIYEENVSRKNLFIV